MTLPPFSSTSCHFHLFADLSSNFLDGNSFFGHLLFYFSVLVHFYCMDCCLISLYTTKKLHYLITKQLYDHSVLVNPPF